MGQAACIQTSCAAGNVIDAYLEIVAAWNGCEFE